jgi:hypothetical protein
MEEHRAPIADHPLAGLSPLQLILSREALLSARLDEEMAKAARNHDDIAAMRAQLSTLRQELLAEEARTHAARIAELKVEENASAAHLSQVNLDLKKFRAEVAEGVELRRGFERRNYNQDRGMILCFILPFLSPI